MKKLRLILNIAFAILMFSQGFAQGNTTVADNINGLYWSPNKDARIQIYSREGRYFGKSSWVAISRKDTKNPDESLNKRDVLGIELLSNFVYNNGVYTEGKIYDPQTGKTYNCRMTLMGNTLKVRGYVGISMFGRTELFERIN